MSFPPSSNVPSRSNIPPNGTAPLPGWSEVVVVPGWDDDVAAGASDEARRVQKLLGPPVGPLAGASWWRLDLSPDDRGALGMWAAAHLALFALAWAAAWVYRTTPSHAPLTGVFEHWDAALLRNIAQYGYFSPHSTANNTAFFPGYPATLAAASRAG